MAKEVLFKKRKCWFLFPIRLTVYRICKCNDDLELIINKGLISQSEEKIKLYKINDMSYKRTFGNFFCGVGNILLETSDQSAGDTAIEKIHGARKFYDKLEELVEEERKRVKVQYKETNIIS